MVDVLGNEIDISKSFIQLSINNLEIYCENINNGIYYLKYSNQVEKIVITK